MVLRVGYIDRWISDPFTTQFVQKSCYDAFVMNFFTNPYAPKVWIRLGAGGLAFRQTQGFEQRHEVLGG